MDQSLSLLWKCIFRINRIVILLPSGVKTNIRLLGELKTMDRRKIIFGLKLAENLCIQAKIQILF